jgi:hypothetical protein
MNTRGNGARAADGDGTHEAKASVVHEDNDRHPVTLHDEQGRPYAQSFYCNSRRWFRAGEDGRGGLTVLSIPGIGHNVNFFGPLAEQLLDPARGIPSISQVVAVDLPAHGGSPLHALLRARRVVPGLRGRDDLAPTRAPRPRGRDSLRRTVARALATGWF